MSIHEHTETARRIYTDAAVAQKFDEALEAIGVAFVKSWKTGGARTFRGYTRDGRNVCGATVTGTIIDAFKAFAAVVLTEAEKIDVAKERTRQWAEADE